MRLASFGLVLMALMAESAHAQSSGLNDTIQDFCASVSNPLTELHPTNPLIRYQYQTMLFRWSDVAPDDPAEMISAKVRQYLDKNLIRLKCSQSDFSPNNGNILKLAVSRQSNRFIDDVIRWGVNLNVVDPADGKTVLDYIVDRQAQYAPTSTYRATLERYYKRFRASGAQHRIELEQAGKVPTLAAEQAVNLARLETSARAGDVNSALRLYTAYSSGTDINLAVTVDLSRARPWLELAGRGALAKHDAGGMFSVGRIYDDQHINDPSASAIWLQRAATAGSVEAAFWLGRYYATGHGVSRDLNRALQLMSAAEAGHVDAAAVWMGSINGWLGRRQDQILWYRYVMRMGWSSWGIPGFDSSGAGAGDPIRYWFKTNNVAVCGPMAKGGTNC